MTPCSMFLVRGEMLTIGSHANKERLCSHGRSTVNDYRAIPFYDDCAWFLLFSFFSDVNHRSTGKLFGVRSANSKKSSPETRVQSHIG